MKKLLLISISFAFLSTSLSAQIEMNSAGDVGIGVSPASGINLYTPEAKITKLGINATNNTTYELLLDGQVKLACGIATPILMDCYLGPYEISLYPSTTNKNFIGRSTAAFNQMWAYDFTDVSDARQKENIVNLSDALKTVLKLQGVKYDIKKEYSYDASKITDQEIIDAYEKDRKNKIGFLAQDVYTILPEVVTYDESEDAYGISYSKVVPVLVEAIKEQQAQIESLQSQVTSLTSLSSDFKAASTNLEPTLDPLDISSDLFQNAPNPFSDETTIKYFLGENVNDASIFIYDMTGKQLKAYKLHHIGSGEINIYGGEFQAGMYMYSLISNGHVIGSRQMILTE